MENNPPILNSPQVVNGNRKKFPFLTIGLSLIFLLVGAGIGYTAYPSLHKPTSEEVIKNQINLQKLPASPQTLENPLITQWNANVEGRLIKKTSSSFTLEKNGNQITLDIHKSLTGFYNQVSAPNTTKKVLQKISIEAIPLNTNLQGGVTIFPQHTGGLNGKLGEHLEANVFLIEKGASK